MSTKVRYSSLDFGVNDSATWTILMPGTFLGGAPDITLNCPNGINVRKQSDPPSSAALTLSGVTKSDIVVFNKVEDDVTEGAVYFSYNSVVLFPVFSTIENHYYLQLTFNEKNNNIVLHDHCYEDFYKSNGQSTSVDVFYKTIKGAYVYDEEKASMIKYDEDEHGLYVQTYDSTTVATPYQANGQRFDSYVELDDISFADYAVKDSVIEVYINASVSVAGLTLNWASNTSVEFQDTVGRFNLGNIIETGSFDNDDVKYTGNRFIVTKKLQPDSKVSTAIRYKIMTDFVNNGYDDIELHDINIMTEMALVEGGDDDA